MRTSINRWTGKWVVILAGLAGLQWAEAETVRIRVGQTVRHTVSIQNPWAEAAAVTAIDLSCSCMSVVEAPAQVPAGGTATLLVAIKPESPGSYRYEIDVALSGRHALTRRYGVDVDVAGATSGDPSARAGISRDLVAKKNHVRDASLWMSATDVLQQVREGTPPLLVDVRSKHRFEASRASRSLHIPAYQLATKQLFRGRHVVLVDEGWGHPGLETRARLLRKRGAASVHILEDGLVGWVMAGGPLEGDRLDHRSLTEIPALEFIEMSRHPGWLILDGSRADRDLVRDLLPDPVRAGDQASLDGVRRMLFMNLDGSGYDYAVSKKVKGKALPVFYLEGGFNGYRKVLQDMTKVRNPGSRRSVGGVMQVQGNPVDVFRRPCDKCP